MVINLTSKVGALVLVRTRGYEYSRLPSLWIAGGGGGGETSAFWPTGG